MNKILESTAFVVKNNEYVHINRDALTELALRWKKEHWEIPAWDSSYHFFDNTERTLTYFFRVDSLNFSFWPLGKSKYTRIYRGKELTGYNALATSLKFAFEQNHPIEKTSYLLTIKKKELLEILDGKQRLPLIERRLHILHQHALILKNQFNGSFGNVVKQAEGDGPALVDLLVSTFPSFRDEDTFQGQQVFFYKRAQILVNDIHGAFGGKGLGAFSGMEKLTAFADYKLPQVLRHWKVLEYDQKLAMHIAQKFLLQKGSPEEIEIRASTIWAVEYLKEELKRLQINVQSREIDWLLWKKAQEQGGMQPNHRTRSIYY
jgi:hypothetical protein